MKTTKLKFPKTLMAVAGAIAIMLATCGVALMATSSVEARSGGIWHGSKFCEIPVDFTCLPVFEVN